MPDLTLPDSPTPSLEYALRKNGPPILETGDSVSFLGVKLPKAKDSSGPFVPDKAKYLDYIDD